ncbi:ABC transporter ATP-binding protein [Paracoccus xiamenensis]|uniref:ABC transporter ATP-binding protein n=1 Tax=Paracoccus xiamenensis TaxID=2714901 RepID=UPI0014092E5D|nr:ABC transporter ATP-binding protein [Paracoccus xiamenensis]NHF74108.1 ABC transporter ATP-binding protein [Paracoccus xiamenensis]
MTPRLTLSQLTKRYGDVHALTDVSLAVAPGERVALLGHNGAGKSTLMKIVLGLIGFDGGTVSVEGAAPGSTAARRMTAYLPENAAFHPALTGRELVCQYLRLRGQPGAQAGALLDRVGLAHAADRRIGTYSKGMRQRVGLAQALIGQPALMVLDEPTSGLDPVSRREFYALIDDLAHAGASVLLSSHALTEVEARTDRLVILSRGRIVAAGTLGDLRARAGLPLSATVTPAPGAIAAVRAALPPDADWRDGQARLALPVTTKMGFLSRVAALGGQVADVEIAPPSLEDIYTHFSHATPPDAAEPRQAEAA